MIYVLGVGSLSFVLRKVELYALCSGNMSSLGFGFWKLEFYEYGSRNWSSRPCALETAALGGVQWELEL